MDIKINVTEYLGIQIYKHSKLVSEEWIPTRTMTAWGKEQLARLVGDVGTSYYINQMRVKHDSAWNTISVTNSNVGHSLNVEGATISTPGTYTEIRCGNSGYEGNYHNTIACNITLPSDSELVLTVRFGFSGLGEIGKDISVARLGHLENQYDYPIYAERFYEPSQESTIDTTNSVSNNVLTCINTTALPGPHIITLTSLLINAPTKFAYVNFSGHSISILSGHELYGKWTITYN